MRDAGRRHVLAAAGVVFAALLAAPLAGAASSGGAVGKALGAYLPGPPRITVEYADGSPAARYEGILRLEFGPYSAWSPGFVNRRAAPGRPGMWQADALVELYRTVPGQSVSLNPDAVEFLKAGTYPLHVYAQTTGALLATGTFVVGDCLAVTVEPPADGHASAAVFRPGEQVTLDVACDQATAGESGQTVGAGAVYIGGRRADVLEWGVMGEAHRVVVRIPDGTPTGAVTVRVVDAAGNEAETTINVAPQSRVVTLSGPEQITAGETARVTARVRDASDQPVAGVRVQFSVVGSAASVDPFEVVTGGDGTASTLVTPGRAGRVRLIAHTGDESAELDIRVAPLPWWDALLDQLMNVMAILAALSAAVVALGFVTAFLPGWPWVVVLRSVLDSGAVMMSLAQVAYGVWAHDPAEMAVGIGALALALIGLGIVSAVGEGARAAAVVTKGHELLLDVEDEWARRREGAADKVRRKGG